MMQVSAHTMTGVYAAQSMKGPAAQLAFKLHTSDERRYLVSLKRAKQDREEDKQKNQKLEQHHE
jgi:hypothetical protein